MNFGQIIATQTRPLVDLPDHWTADDTSLATAAGFKIDEEGNQTLLEHVRAGRIVGPDKSALGVLYMVLPGALESAWHSPRIRKLYLGMKPGFEYWTWAREPGWPDEFNVLPLQEGEHVWPPEARTLCKEVPHREFGPRAAKIEPPNPGAGTLWRIDVFGSTEVTEPLAQLWRSSGGEQRWYSRTKSPLLDLGEAGLRFRTTATLAFSVDARELRLQEERVILAAGDG